jgi:hypothetical protein
MKRPGLRLDIGALTMEERVAYALLIIVILVVFSQVR